MTSPSGAPTPDPTDAELVARQATLQAEAAAAIADLDLFPLLGTVGRPVQTGSVALGLMVWRDIDVTILCPTLDLGVALEPLRSLAIHPRVRQVQFRNDTGAWNVDPDYPDGLYLGLDYRSTVEQPWKLDLWFLLDGTTQFDVEHVESLPPRLTTESRLAILRIKDVWHRRPEYRSVVRSYDIYAAVLDHGVRTPDEFAAHIAARPRANGQPAAG